MQTQPSALILLPKVPPGIPGLSKGCRAGWKLFLPPIHFQQIPLVQPRTIKCWLNAISTTQTSGHILQGWVGRGTVVLNGTQLARLVFQMVYPGGVKGLKLWLPSSITVSQTLLLFSSAWLLKRMRKSPKAQTLPFNLIFLSKSETMLRNKLWQSLYSKSEHLYPWIIFGFF